jgi:hypothetical protein
MVKIVYICAFEIVFPRVILDLIYMYFLCFCAFLRLRYFLRFFIKQPFYAFEIDFLKHILRNGNL